jgi:hypothetical protein
VNNFVIFDKGTKSLLKTPMQLKLIVKKKCRRLTALGWVLLLFLLYFVYRLFLGDICAYLSINEPVPAKTLVVEGWVGDQALKNALDYFHTNGYEHLVVTGQPITQWKNYVKFKNTAEGAVAVLRDYGFRDTIFQAVIPRTVFIDRTYNTAVATRILFEKHPTWAHRFNIFSEGVHARRTRLMFLRAFSDDYQIGILSDVDPTFDPKHWWKTSKGFRNVSNEFVAFSYVWFFFHPNYALYRQKLLEGFYIDTVQNERAMKDVEVSDSATSPLVKKLLNDFTGLKYFPVNQKYRVKAKFDVDTSGAVFEMPTNTARKPKYRVYAHLTFHMDDTLGRLTAYQNMAYIRDSVWGKLLFVPFRDKTCEQESYGAGRYIDLAIPAAGDSVWIDFNRAYNPYCAYADRWSCPLVPVENWLNLYIRAGEKKYRNHHDE